MIKKTILILALALFYGCLGLNSFAQGKATEQIAAAANKFLASLDDGQRAKVVYDFKDQAQRKRWSNLPTGIFRRAGLRMGELTPPQREAALAVLAAAFEPAGL